MTPASSSTPAWLVGPPEASRRRGRSTCAGRRAGAHASAKREFEDGHIPGAAFLDIDRDLAGDAVRRTGPAGTRCPTPTCSRAKLGGAGDRRRDARRRLRRRPVARSPRGCGGCSGSRAPGARCWTAASRRGAAGRRDRVRPGAPRERAIFASLAVADRPASPTPSAVESHGPRRDARRSSTRAPPSATAARPSPSTRWRATSPARGRRRGPRTSTRTARSARPRSSASATRRSGSRATPTIALLRVGRDRVPRPVRDAAWRVSATRGSTRARGRTGCTRPTARSPTGPDPG